MRVVIDGLPVRGGSLAHVVEQLLRGWCELATGDELHLLVGPDAQIKIPPEVDVRRIDLGASSPASRIWHQSTAIRAVCSQVRADVMLGVLPSTAIGPLPCPRAIIAHDLRHEIRKEQFSRRFRLVRGISYGIGFRQADAIACISAGTRDDVLASRRWLDPDRVRVAHLGADHVLNWARREDDVAEYAIAFGQYRNKNVAPLLQAWHLLAAQGVSLPLVIVGLRPSRMTAARELVEEYGLDELVTLRGWLSAQEFQSTFSAAGMVVFPSDFEGFGMPALEAMRLGIPLVITPERTLLAVTGGHATAARGWRPEDIAGAVSSALPLIGQPPDPAAVAWAATFTWQNTAGQIRALLDDIASASRPPSRL